MSTYGYDSRIIEKESFMGVYGGFYKGDKKKKKKELLERQVGKIVHIYTPPRVEIIGKGKREK